MESLKTNLEKKIHLRVPKDFEEKLMRIADAYKLKKSTFCRIILMRELSNYDKSRFFA